MVSTHVWHMINAPAHRVQMRLLALAVLADLLGAGASSMALLDESVNELLLVYRSFAVDVVSGPCDV